MARRAFTLVEMLVVVAAVGVLLGLILPALGSARRSAQSAACLGRLGGIMHSHGTYSASHGDKWLNPLAPGVFAAYGASGDTAQIITNVLHTTVVWPYFLQPDLLEPRGSSGEGVSCPAFYATERDSCDAVPAYGAGSSYWYSPAFTTEWDLWKQGAEARRREPDRYRRLVGTNEVRFTSQKAVLFEPADLHGSKSRLDDPKIESGTRVNVAFADGHAGRVDPTEASPALPVAWPFWSGLSRYGPTAGTSLPFSCSEDGYRGRDF